jgi:hypothetical protein
MWGLEALWHVLAPCRTEWRVFHDEMTMECRIVKVTNGTEIQYILGGQPYHRFIHATRADAQDEARRKLAELIERGWLERAPEPEFVRA